MATSDILNSLSSSGLSTGSGIDVTSTVNQLIANLRSPEQVWQTQQKMLEVQVSALTQLNTEVSTLSTAVDNLGDVAGNLMARSVTSSQPGLVTASASNATPIGTHTVVVNSLATTSSYYTDSVATSSTPLATGTFTVKVGSAAAATITIDGTNNTLDTLAASINNRGLGVTASVINDANGSRLAIVANNSGAASDLTITNVSSGLAFTKGSTGLNASLTVDGVPIDSASNVVTGTVAGLTLNLVGAAPNTQIQVGITPDSTHVKQAVTDFVTAYNTIIQDLSSQFTFNTTTGSAGPLMGDAVARLIQSQLLNAATYNADDGSPVATLADLGISMNNDGTLTIDDAKLSAAVDSNFTAVQNFFRPTTGTGFASSLKDMLTPLTDSTQGAFTIEIKGMNDSKQSFQDQIDNFEIYIASQRTLLTAQYTQVDLALRQLPLLQQEIDSELSSLSTNSNQ